MAGANLKTSVNSSHYGVGTYYILIENNYYYSHISNKHINISFNDNTNYSIITAVGKINANTM